MHPPVDLHMNSDIRQDSVGMTTVQLINSVTISQLITAAAQVVITVAVASADSNDYDDTQRYAKSTCKKIEPCEYE